jgi:hypothetical protein
MDILNYRKMELQKITLRLGKDYYPVTETLCSNACIQANWLHDNGEDLTTDQTALFRELYDKVKQHIGLCMGILQAPVDTFAAEKIKACTALLDESREAINHVLDIISKAKIFAQNKNEMLDNLRVKMTVIHNVLTEIFKIEQEEIVPLLQEQF